MKNNIWTDVFIPADNNDEVFYQEPGISLLNLMNFILISKETLISLQVLKLIMEFMSLKLIV